MTVDAIKKIRREAESVGKDWYLSVWTDEETFAVIDWETFANLVFEARGVF